MNLAGARKVALVMATMHPADRRWMLSRMPTNYRDVLQPLIGDACRFADLDPDLLQQALDESAPVPMANVPSPAVLIGVLDGLSSQWAARVLTAVAADHVEIYLAACGKLRGEAVRHEVRHVSRPAPRALAQALGRCLEEAGHALKAEDSR